MMTDSFSTHIPTNDDALPVVNLSADDIEYPIGDYPERVVVPVLFAIIFVVGLIGNAILIFIVLRNKPMRTKPNVLIVNLSIGDSLLILFSVPFTSVIYTFSEWHFGSAMCKLNEFMQTLSLGVSIFTLTALSADRFIAIVYPQTAPVHSSRSLARVILTSVVIWVMSTGLALMDLVGAHAGPCPHCEPQIQICYLYPEEWGEGYKAFRVIFRFVVYFAVPLIVIVCLYVIIAIVLLRHHTSTLSSQMGVNASSSSSPGPSVSRAPCRLRQRSADSVAMAKQSESRKKVAKVVLSFVVIFVVCWLPRHIHVMCFHFKDDFEYNMEWHVFKVAGFCLMFIYSAINPLALYLLNAEYRRYFRHYLFGCCYKPWRLTDIGNRRSTSSSVIGRSTYSMMSTGAAGITTCSDAAAVHRGASRTSVTTETASDVIGSQTMITTTKASFEDDHQKGAK